MRCLAVVLLAAAVAGCAAPGMPPSQAQLSARGDAATDRGLYADLIRGMIDQQNFYAALAHIQAQQQVQGATPELRHLEAETRRRLGQNDAAQSLYEGLLRSPLAGAAYHGLGLLYAGRDSERSIGYLRQAATRQPTHAQTRNDLGYALAVAGDYPAALVELATAVELDPASDKARNNLALLLMLSGDEDGVQRIVRETGMTADAVQRLRQQASALKPRDDTAFGEVR